MRPLGAFVFGRLADRYGRKPILMLDVCLFSVLELASAFAPTLTVLLVLRALFGFAMGGEWGIGASLVMESIPAKSRGWVSGFLQQGYAFGYLIAAVVYYSLFELIGYVRRRHYSGAARPLYPHAREGIAGVAGDTTVWRQRRHA
jgi:SHS family lactate transporter-like MFS transporter